LEGGKRRGKLRKYLVGKRETQHGRRFATMVEHISTTYHLEPVEACVLASLVVDLKISEIVDKSNWIVSSYLPLAVFG
jgi:acetamidase/formamidase